MQVITAPESLEKAKGFKVFLAGSIEQDTAEQWQNRIIEALKDTEVCILNPRRKEWDASWVQERSNSHFAQQVYWEINGQMMSDLIVMWFDPNTKSPITLLELGLFKDKNIFVYCPKGFWRKGNVDIVCDMFNIPQVHSFEELVISIKNRAALYGGSRQEAQGTAL